MNSRLLAGIAAAALVAVVARRGRSLTTDGAAAAFVVGALAMAVAWSWGALVVVYFAATSALSRFGVATKARHTAGIVAKSGARDAVQVLANGGAFAAAAIGMLVAPNDRWVALAVGSLAASAADTWATEIGTLIGAVPRSIVTLRRVPPGTSGGITVAGTLGSVGGAAFVAGTAALFGLPRNACTAAFVGGFAGALIDSLLGATMQARAWCDACNVGTERRIHVCGGESRHAGGIAWMNNDAVNLLSGAAGGLLAAILSG